MNTQEIKAVFTIDDENFFEGTYDPTDDWNGFAIPVFDWENALKIAQWLQRLRQEYPELETAKVLVRERQKQIHIIEDDGVTVYDGPTYAIGAAYWCWTVKTVKGD